MSTKYTCNMCNLAERTRKALMALDAREADPYRRLAHRRMMLDIYTQHGRHRLAERMQRDIDAALAEISEIEASGQPTPSRGGA